MAVATVWVVALVMVWGNAPVSDELQHLAQAIGFSDGDFDLDDTITILPGYHAVIAVPLALLGSDSANVARITTLLVAALGVWAMHRATRVAEDESLADNARALQWAVLPIAAPYAFLIFTDQLAALTVLVMWLLLRADRLEWAGVAAIAAVLVRQTNIYWAAGLCLVDLMVRTGSLSAALQSLRRPATWIRYWTFAVPIGIVVAIVVSTGTVAIGDTDIHRIGVYPENVLFMVMVAGGLFWPVLVDSASSTGKQVQAWAGAAAVSAIVYLVAWDPNHVFNQFGGTRFVRNWLLNNSMDRAPVRVLLLFALLFGFFVLSRIELRESVAHVFYPIAALALIPQELVEQRYYIVPIMMLLILRRAGSARSERLLFGWWALVTLAIAVAMFGLDRIVI